MHSSLLLIVPSPECRSKYARLAVLLDYDGEAMGGVEWPAEWSERYQLSLRDSHSLLISYSSRQWKELIQSTTGMKLRYSERDGISVFASFEPDSGDPLLRSWYNKHNLTNEWMSDVLVTRSHAVSNLLVLIRRLRKRDLLWDFVFRFSPLIFWLLFTGASY